MLYHVKFHMNAQTWLLNHYWLFFHLEYFISSQGGLGPKGCVGLTPMLIIDPFINPTFYIPNSGIWIINWILTAPLMLKFFPWEITRWKFVAKCFNKVNVKNHPQPMREQVYPLMTNYTKSYVPSPFLKYMC